MLRLWLVFVLILVFCVWCCSFCVGLFLVCLDGLWMCRLRLLSMWGWSWWICVVWLG